MLSKIERNGTLVDGGLLAEQSAQLGKRIEELKAQAYEQAGGEFAMRTTEIPGHGKFAIYILGGVQHGLWQS